MPFLIQMTNRNTRLRAYVGARYIGESKPGDDVPKETTKVYDFKNELFETLKEAKPFAYGSAEAAAMVISSLPETQNMDYEVIEVRAGEGPGRQS